MKTVLALVTLLLFSNLAFAQVQQVVVIHQGKAYLVPLTPDMIIPVARTGDLPGVPDNPGNPPQSTLSQEITGWTKAINPAAKAETVKALVMATKAIRSQVASGKTQWSDVWGGKKLFATAYDVILEAQGDTNAWKTWRTKHTGEVIKQTQDPSNGLNSKEEVIQLLADTEAGLQGYLDQSSLFRNINWKKVVTLFRLLIKIESFDITTIWEIIDILFAEARQAGRAIR